MTVYWEHGDRKYSGTPLQIVKQFAKEQRLVVGLNYRLYMRGVGNRVFRLLKVKINTHDPEVFITDLLEIGILMEDEE